MTSMANVDNVCSSMHKAKDFVSKNAKRLSTRMSLLSTSPTDVQDIVRDLGSAPSPPPPVIMDGTDLSVPKVLQEGVEMIKISDKKQKRILFKIDPDEGQIMWKSRKSGIIPIETIKEIRTGANTSYYRNQYHAPEDWESRWLTIIYIIDNQYKTLHMVADTPAIFTLWDVALQKLRSVRQGLMSGFGNLDLRQTIWERQYWKGADEEGDQKLDFDDVERLCQRLNVSLNDSQLRKLFQDADSQSRGYLDFQDFRRFIKVLKYRPELNMIYENIKSHNDGKFDFDVFKAFMRETQKSSIPEEELKSIFARYIEISIDKVALDQSMSLDQFSSFLLSPDNAVFSDYRKTIWQDMSRPISDYYISSSHNTYLVGHQLVGVSTIEGYVRALLHNCRSVELDVYDGESEPVIYHGRTFTSKVPLRDICHAISKYAFVTSPYPVIISAEVHCGIQQQEKLVDIMTAVFGDSLIHTSVDNRPKLQHLPSPEELKNKILLKAKHHDVVARLEEEYVQKMRMKAHAEQRRETLFDFSSSSSSSSESEFEEKIRQGLKSGWHKLRGKDKSGVEKQKPLMSFRLAGLLVYTVGVKCRGIGSNALVQYSPEHIFSLSENGANRLLKTIPSMRDFIRHTQKNLVRIYPKGLRVSSSNYEPYRYWAAGAQIAAINWQTFDLGYIINQAMFQRNGQCGYVLKPEALRAEGGALLNKRTKHFFEVMIISAQQLPRLRNRFGQEIIEKSVMDPFVDVTLHIPDWTSSPFIPSSSSDVTYQPPTDTPSDTPTAARRVSNRTRVIKTNGFNPVWQEQFSIPFDCVGGKGMQDLIFVEFSVRQEGREDENDDPIALYCAPMSTFEPGYRHLPLHDMQFSQHIFSTLFVRINIRDVE